MDLNLLRALDHLLREESVTTAAEQLHLSAPAMSRTLGRLRALLGDPLLVRAGRRLVPTPHALSLRERVHALVEEADAIVRATPKAAAPSLERTFVVRANDAVSGFLGGAIVELLHAKTPRVAVRFAPEGDEEVEALRDGQIDLDVGVASNDAPELRVQVLARNRFVGVVRKGHPLVRGGRVTAKRFAEQTHISVSRRGRARGPIDDELRSIGLTRHVALVVPSFYGALFAALGSDLVAAVPTLLLAHLRSFADVASFPLPVTVPVTNLAQSWHPRFDFDPAHQWLRACIKKACSVRASVPESVP